MFDVIGRFMHMNVDLYGFVSALNAILAQRLVRLVCVHCAEEDVPSPELLSGVGPHAGSDKTGNSRSARVPRMPRRWVPRAQGDRGALILNDEMRELITSRADPHAQGHRGEERHALPARGRARGGAARQTTLEEINRVTFVA